MNDSAGAMAGLGPLLHAAGSAQGHVEERLAPLGLSLPKLAALDALHEAGESLPLSQLAERLSCVKSNITQLVDRLEADGFVSRGQDPNDRRARLALLTDAGRKAHQKGLRLRDEAVREIFGALTAAEARQFSSLMDKITRRTG